MLLEYSEVTVLPVFSCTLSFASLLRSLLEKNSNHTHYLYVGMFEELGEHRQREEQQKQIAGRTLDSYESTHQKGKCVV